MKMRLKVQNVRIDANLIDCAIKHGEHESAVEVIEAALYEYIIKRIGTWDELRAKLAQGGGDQTNLPSNKEDK